VRCSVVDVYRRFRGAYCLAPSYSTVKATSSSETSVSFYQTKRFNSSEDRHLYIWLRENLKSRYVLILVIISYVSHNNLIGLQTFRMSVFFVKQQKNVFLLVLYTEVIITQALARTVTCLKYLPLDTTEISCCWHTT
jgi:hypothetical protein